MGKKSGSLLIVSNIVENPSMRNQKAEKIIINKKILRETSKRATNLEIFVVNVHEFCKHAPECAKINHDGARRLHSRKKKANS